MKETTPLAPLSHFDATGQAHMVGIAHKAETLRQARAAGRILMQPATLALIEAGDAAKGDVLGIARIAGITGAKRAPDLIPLAHPVSLSKVTVTFAANHTDCAIECQALAECIGRTGVEMEALTAVTAALLTIYDMCKSADRGMTIDQIRLLEKSGGASVHWQAQ